MKSINPVRIFASCLALCFFAGQAGDASATAICQVQWPTRTTFPDNIRNMSICSNTAGDRAIGQASSNGASSYTVTTDWQAGAGGTVESRTYALDVSGNILCSVVDTTKAAGTPPTTTCGLGTAPIYLYVWVD